MKKLNLFLVFIMLSITVFGQDIIIDFAGEGASTEVTTVEIVNLSNCTSITVPGGSSLNLTNYSNDASLSDLRVSGSTVANFASTTLTYDVELPSGTTEVPVVDATATDINATFEVTDATELPGLTTVVVTAEDGETEQTYTINFSVATGIADNFSQANLVKSYPNPFNSSTTIEFYVNQHDNVQITICDIAGKIVAQNSQTMTTGIHSYEFTAGSMGMYFINVSGSDFVYSSKVMCISDISQGSQLVYKEQISNTLTEKSFFNDNTEIITQTEKDFNSKDFSFTEGDMLKIKGISGDYATVMVVEPTVSETYTFDFVACQDNDGNNYAVVEIGDQTWMAENIKTTSYVGGVEIPLVEDNTEWGDLEDNDEAKAYCFYDNDENSVYGALYTYAATTNGDNSGTGVQGVCPTGWHIPSDDEWKDLEMELGMSQAEADATGWRGTNEGGKLKSTCMELWNAPNTGATNESGFLALPGGFRNNGDGVFGNAGNYGVWWSATQDIGDYVWGRDLFYGLAEVNRHNASKSVGFSVRCLRD